MHDFQYELVYYGLLYNQCHSYKMRHFEPRASNRQTDRQTDRQTTRTDGRTDSGNAASLNAAHFRCGLRFIHTGCGAVRRRTGTATQRNATQHGAPGVKDRTFSYVQGGRRPSVADDISRAKLRRTIAEREPTRDARHLSRRRRVFVLGRRSTQGTTVWATDIHQPTIVFAPQIINHCRPPTIYSPARRRQIA